MVSSISMIPNTPELLETFYRCTVIASGILPESRRDGNPKLAGSGCVLARKLLQGGLRGAKRIEFVRQTHALQGGGRIKNILETEKIKLARATEDGTLPIGCVLF